MTTNSVNDNGFSKFNQLIIEELYLYRLYDGKISDQAEWVDLTSMQQEFNIYEDITSQVLSATIAIVDPFNVPDKFPLVGGERIKLKYKSTAETESKELIWVVYKVGNRVKTTGAAKAQVYVLYLCTEDRWLDANIDVSKAYSGTYSDMVKECLNELESTRPLSSSESTGNASFISNYWSPLKSVAFCAKRAITDTHSPFLFWETVDGYNFKSMTDIFKQTAYKTIYYEPRLNAAHMDSLDKSLNTVTRFEMKESNDKLKQYADGTYGSRIFYFNLGTKIVELVESDYRNTFKDGLSHLEEFPLTDDMANKRHKNTVKMSTLDDSYRGAYLRDMVFDHLTNYRILVELPGDASVRAGMIINFELPALSNTTGEYRKELLVSGKWLIASIRHKIGRESYQIFLELVKDSHAVDIQQSVYGKTKTEIDEDDIKRKGIPQEVMGVAEILNDQYGQQGLSKTDQSNASIDFTKEFMNWANR